MPSVIASSLTTANIAETSVSVIQNVGSLAGAGQSGNSSGQSEIAQTDSGGKVGVQPNSGAGIHVTVRLNPVSLQPIADSNNTGDNEQAQDDTGQGGGQSDAQGQSQGDQGVIQSDQQDGQDNTSDNLQGDNQPDLEGNGQGDPGVSQNDSQGRQNDDNGTSSTQGQGDGGPSSTGTCTGNGQNEHPRTSTPDDQSDTQQFPPDTGQSSMVNNGLASSANGKLAASSSSSLADGSNGSAVGTSDGLNSAANSQAASGDKRSHSPSSVTGPDVEQRGPTSTPDGKQHAADGGVIQGDDNRSPISAGNQELRSQVTAQLQPSHAAMDDVGQRQVQDQRFISGEGFLKPTAVEPYMKGERTSMPFVSYVAEELPPDGGEPNLAPQNYGLLTDRLALDMASLRSEVQRFLAQIDELGARGTERKIGMVLCSGALAVAAAMACEVARRQARRPVSGPMIGRNPEVDLGHDADDDSASIDLPNLAQFSALS